MKQIDQDDKHEIDVHDKGVQLLLKWLDARRRVSHAESELNSAQCALSNTEIALLRLLLPQNIKAGEKIAIWLGDSLIQAECLDTNIPGLPNGKITIRQAGKNISETL